MNIDCPTFLRRYRIEVGIACAFLIGLVAHSTIAGAQPADEASHTLPLVTPASHPGRQGFVRIINRSDDSGAVRIHAIDDAGERFGPVSLSLDAQQTRHFTSQDLETGNAARGLSGEVGDGSGNWRLELSTALDIEALAYIRTPDVMSSIHEVAAEEGEGSMRYRVPLFNPGSNRTRRSWLRLVNPGQSEARIVISARDDGGAPAESDVRLKLPGGEARALSAQQLEAGGSEFEGRFGDGTGKWQLSVSADRPLLVMSLLESPTGNLTNLSSPGSRGAQQGGDGTSHTLALVTPASNSGQQGFVRIINRSDDSGAVRIHAIDDTGERFGPVSLSLDAQQTRHFTSQDLETGNASRGLSGGGRGRQRPLAPGAEHGAGHRSPGVHPNPGRHVQHPRGGGRRGRGVDALPCAVLQPREQSHTTKLAAPGQPRRERRAHRD